MKKKKDKPHAKRLGWLKNGNPPCDLRSMPKCHAKAKSSGKRCGNLAVKGKRVCWIHGGKSTGPRSSEGLERSRKANWKHGYYSAEMVAERQYVRSLLRESNDFVKRIR
jgi:hypothetical protein